MAFKAAMIPLKQGRMEVKTVAEMYTPSEDEILIKNYAIASNPADYMVQRQGISYLENDYPIVLGEDVAGLVEAVGPGVTHFKIGDRVSALVSYGLSKQNKYGAFQEYSVAPAISATKIPDSITFAQAASIPLTYATAITALYSGTGLERPKLDKPSKKRKEIALVWGASASVGSCCVQILSRAGYRVFATASKHNHDLVKSWGAEAVFDYHDADVVEQIKKAAGGPIKIGCEAYSFGTPSAKEKLLEIIAPNGILCLVSAPPPNIPSTMTVGQGFALFVWHPEYQEMAKYFFHDYLEKGLKEGFFVPNLIEECPGWIDGIQEMVDKHAAGVSGKKLVVVRSQ